MNFKAWFPDFGSQAFFLQAIELAIPRLVAISPYYGESKLKRISAICALLLLTLPVFGSTSKSGKIYYVKSHEVLEVDLKTKSEKIAVPNELIPEQLRGKIETAVVSPSGKYLLLKDVSDGFWIWNREDKTTKFLSKGEVFTGYYKGPVWSAYNDYLLWNESLYYKPQTEKVEISRPEKAKNLVYGPFPNVTLTNWAENGKGLIIVGSKDQKSEVYLQPLTGRRKLLFKWPREIIQITQSHNGTHYAIWDKSGIYLTDDLGKNAKRLPIKIDGTTETKFNTSGSKLAVFTNYNYGEPHIYYDYALYIIDTTAKRVMKPNIAWTASSIQFDTEEYLRYLDGWMADNKTVRIGAEVLYGGGGWEIPAQRDWIRMWVVDPSRKDNHEVEIFDSGGDCTSASFWPNR